ncbi:pseudouridine synthase [Acidiferrobacter sp.]|uniref:pseudouridine synthase n=1 Tax=Acidiferrobacter sp. TaxID=1872107 RepID=UPI002620A546|nr:pseudouridine synthase [Acidiferrobacter sp.]
MSEKLQKILAQRGLGSRREMERIILAGRVRIGGRVATLGERVDAHEDIVVDGWRLAQRPPAKGRVLMYHKMAGEMCTRSDPRGRPLVFDKLPAIRQGRWVAVGRLDLNSSGLMLFTTDGELAARLMHPSTGVVRRYAVRVLGRATPDVLRQLTKGVMLEDGIARFTDVKDAGGDGANHWYQVAIMEGRKREVRRLFAAAGLVVSRLIRIAYGPIELPRTLRPGFSRALASPAVADLYAAAGLIMPQKAR